MHGGTSGHDRRKHAYSGGTVFCHCDTESCGDLRHLSPPEAQLDRFLLCLHLGYPAHDAEKEILLGASKPVTEPVCTAEQLFAARAACEQVLVSDAMLEYLLALAEKTRKDRTVQVGLSTRGVQAIQKTAKAWAAMQGRDYVIPEDIMDIAAEVMAHRLIMKGGASLQKMDFRHEAALRMIEETAVPTEP